MLGPRIREALADRDMVWLSRATGISTSTLSDYSRGKLPRTDKALRIARALHTTVEWLFSKGGEAPPPPELVDESRWAMLPRYDILAFSDGRKPDPVEQVPVDRAWLRSLGRDQEGLWITTMPSNMAEIAREGESLLCRDVDEDLVEGRVYIFMREDSPVIRRVAFHPDGFALISPDPMTPPLVLDRREPRSAGLIAAARVLATFGLVRV